MQSGPLQLVLYGAFSFLARIHRQLDIVVVTSRVTALFAGSVPAAVRGGRRLLGLGSSAGLEALVAGCALLLGVTDGLANYGHPAEVVIPGLWVAAGIAAVRGRPGVAGCLLGLSAGWEPWGALGAPVLLMVAAGRPRLRASVSGSAIAAGIYLPFLLTGHFAMGGFAWSISPHSLVHVLWPHARTFSWLMRLIQGATALTAGALVAWSARRTVMRVWAVPMAIVLVRLALDPLVLPYYWLEVATLALVGLALTGSTSRVQVIGLGALMYSLLFVTPLARGLSLALAAATVVMVLRDDLSAAGSRALRGAPVPSVGVEDDHEAILTA